MEWSAVMQGEVDGFETPINLCNHAYWNLSGDFSEPTVADHLLELKSDKVFRFNQFQCPTEYIDDVEGTVFDFRKIERVADKDRLTGAIDGGGKPGLDNAFVVRADQGPDYENEVLREVAVLKSVKSGIEMTVKSTQPVVVIYTTNWVPESDTKHRQHAAICLETCAYPDAINQRNVRGFPTKPVLTQGGKPYKQTTIHYFSSK